MSCKRHTSLNIVLNILWMWNTESPAGIRITSRFPTDGMKPTLPTYWICWWLVNMLNSLTLSYWIILYNTPQVRHPHCSRDSGPGHCSRDSGPVHCWTHRTHSSEHTEHRCEILIITLSWSLRRIKCMRFFSSRRWWFFSTSSGHSVAENLLTGNISTCCSEST